MPSCGSRQCAAAPQGKAGFPAPKTVPFFSEDGAARTWPPLQAGSVRYSPAPPCTQRIGHGHHQRRRAGLPALFSVHRQCPQAVSTGKCAVRAHALYLVQVRDELSLLGQALLRHGPHRQPMALSSCFVGKSACTGQSPPRMEALRAGVAVSPSFRLRSHRRRRRTCGQRSRASAAPQAKASVFGRTAAGAQGKAASLSLTCRLSITHGWLIVMACIVPGNIGRRETGNAMTWLIRGGLSGLVVDSALSGMPWFSATMPARATQQPQRSASCARPHWERATTHV